MESEKNQIANDNFNVWNQALQTKDPEKVAALYTADASFLPTLSPDFKKGIEGAKEYFIHFLEKDPVGEIIEEAVQPLGDNVILHSGMYNFEVGPADAREQVKARFTLVWQKGDSGKWLIIHHHSSLKPQE